MYKNDRYYSLNRDRIVQIRLNEVIKNSSSFKIGTTVSRIPRKNTIDEPDRFEHITELCTFRAKVMAQYLESFLVDTCLNVQIDGFVNTRDHLTGQFLPDGVKEYRVYAVWTSR